MLQTKKKFVYEILYNINPHDKALLSYYDKTKNWATPSTPLVIDNVEVYNIFNILSIAVKYLGKQNGFQGGNLLNLSSSTELFHKTTNIQSPSSNTLKPSSVSRCEEGAETCSVLGTTRGLGVAKNVDVHGVKIFTVYQPSIDYPELSVAAQITDDEHSPYYQWNR